MNPVISFEIPVIDLERATTFYSAVFGFKLARTRSAKTHLLVMSIFPAKAEEPGIGGALRSFEDRRPSADGVLLHFQCLDLNETLRLVVANGGSVLTEAEELKYSGFATVTDSEGNQIGILESRLDQDS